MVDEEELQVFSGGKRRKGASSSLAGACYGAGGSVSGLLRPKETRGGVRKAENGLSKRGGEKGECHRG